MICLENIHFSLFVELVDYIVCKTDAIQLKSSFEISSSADEGTFLSRAFHLVFCCTAIIDQLEPCAVQRKLCKTNNETNCGH